MVVQVEHILNDPKQFSEVHKVMLWNVFNGSNPWKMLLLSQQLGQLKLIRSKV